MTIEEKDSLRFQIGTSKEHGGRRYLPYVFTEQGVAMLSAVLRSQSAVQMSIHIINAFVDMRRFISNNALIFQRLDSLEQKQFKTTIYTKNITKQLELDLQKHHAQYPHIDVKKFDASHDGFLFIDEKEVYHIGASLKDLGKKWFAFSKLDIGVLNILEKFEK